MGGVLVLLGAVLAMPAAAQPAAEAQALYDRGVRLYHRHALQEALDAMIASNRLVENAGVTFNIAQIHALLEHPTEAFNGYRRYLTLLDGSDASQDRARAEARLQELTPQVALIDVHTDPDGARLFLDRIDLGTVGDAPLQLAVAPGAHALIAQAPGYSSATQPFVATVGQAVSVALSLERLLCAVMLTSEPAGAEVFMAGRGESLGVTPLRTSLPVGGVDLQIERSGYLPAVLRIEVEAATAIAPEVTRHVVLVRDPAQLSALQVRATPQAASATLVPAVTPEATPSERVGRTPFASYGLPPGTYRLRVARVGHVPFERDIDLLGGLSTDVDVVLAPRVEPIWPGFAYLGYGVGGAVFLAGGALGVAAVVARNDGDRDVQARNNWADALMLTGLLTVAVTWVMTDLLAPVQAPSTARIALRRGERLPVHSEPSRSQSGTP